MNNGFLGSFTPMGNNMGLTCQPNFNGQQPGHCVLHHVDNAPGVSFTHHISAVQNRAMDTPRPPRKIWIDQSEFNKDRITLNKNVERLKISPPSLPKNKNDLQKQLTQAQSLLSKALKEQCLAKKDAAKKIPIADEKEKYFIKKYAYNAIRDRCDTVEKRIADGDILYKAIVQSQYQWREWVDFRNKLIQKENAIKHLDDVNLNVNDIRKSIDKITLEIKKIEALEPAAKPAASALAQKSYDSFLSSFLSHNFLSNVQQTQKSKALAECQTALCEIGQKAKWAITDLTQGTSFAAGMVAGVPAGLYETVDGIVKTASNPAEAYSGLKALAESGNILGNMASAAKQSWADSIDRMEAEYQKGSISGAFNAGVEGGKLATDIGGLAMSGAVVIEKSMVKAASKADPVIRTAADIALASASTPERMAGSMAPKVVSDTAEAARLVGQQTLKSTPFMTVPPLVNPFPAKGLVDRLTLATPQQIKIAEQLLDIGIKASITCITAITLKDIADRITADELNHITTLSTAGNLAATSDYLSSLQDKYAPAHTGNPPLAPQVPNHTGNNQVSGQGVTHTGNTIDVTGDLFRY